MKTKEIVCIRCPLSCRLSVDWEDDGSVSRVTGNSCPKGDSYAREEILNPQRILTTSLKVSGGLTPLVSVKTSGAISKHLIRDAQEYLRHLEVKAPVAEGQVLVGDLLGTGVTVVATKSALSRGDVPVN